jgi:endonuclease-3
MAASARASLLTKAHTVLKKHYTPRSVEDRSVLETTIYALLLEDASFEAADQAFEVLKTTYFDWNEVRVCTARDLAQSVAMLPHGDRAGRNIRAFLQAEFDRTYQFDLEGIRKLNQSKATHYLDELKIKKMMRGELLNVYGTTNFAVAVVTQVCLGGHAIAVDDNSLKVLGLICGEAPDQAASGLERAIPKNKGPEFFSLLHQMAAEYAADSQSPTAVKALIEIQPDLKAQFAADLVAETEAIAKGTKKKAAKKTAAAAPKAAKKAAKTTKAAKKPEPEPVVEEAAPTKKKPTKRKPR